jgi:hypothetical protein
MVINRPLIEVLRGEALRLPPRNDLKITVAV